MIGAGVRVPSFTLLLEPHSLVLLPFLSVLNPHGSASHHQEVSRECFLLSVFFMTFLAEITESLKLPVEVTASSYVSIFAIGAGDNKYCKAI